MPKSYEDLLAEIKKLEEKNRVLRIEVRQAKRAGITDERTGLYTLRFLSNRFRALDSEAKRHGYTDLFVIFLDVDRFKLVNDTHGHAVGDAVLAAVAEQIKRNVRQNDVAARYGGDEMVVLGRGDGLIVAERIRHAVAQLNVDGVQVTTSIGLAYFQPGCDDTLDKTRGRADAAMYQAKKAGRNQVCQAQESTPA